MNLSTVDDESTNQTIDKPEEIDWHMLNKSKFFILGAGLFSCVSATLYPIVVLKTRQQVYSSHLSTFKTAVSIIKYQGFPCLYKGFGTSLLGSIPARAVYMTALEVTKTSFGITTVKSCFSEPTGNVISNAIAGLTAAIAAQVVWTPIDVVSQRLMVQGKTCKYVNGIDAFRKIGVRGLYRGFGMSVMTYAPSNAVWWASYSGVQRLVWGGVGRVMCRKDSCDDSVAVIRPDSRTVMAVQGVSAAMAGGVSALVTMPLDTIKTRLQVIDNNDDNSNGNGNGNGSGNGRKGPTVGQTVRSLVREGGWMALYRGLGPRWASMSMSSTTMITTYELLKRLSTKSDMEEMHNP